MQWGPYGRKTYGRGWWRAGEFSQTIAATYKMVGALTAIFVSLLKLVATYAMVGYRIRLRLGKVLLAQYKESGNMVKRALKPLAATYKMLGSLTTVATYYRTLTATYKMVGTLTKRMYKTLIATTVYLASRLRLQYVIGWDYSGDFEADDRIKIDEDRLTVTLNGVNALHLVSGSIPFFNPGANTLTYEDSEGTRTVRIRVAWKGRWQ